VSEIDLRREPVELQRLFLALQQQSARISSLQTLLSDILKGNDEISQLVFLYRQRLNQQIEELRESGSTEQRTASELVEED